jgi:peptide deformylase
MSQLKIVTYPDTFLSGQAKKVENIDGKIQKIIDDMASIMYEAPGIGLAAMQVGIDKSIIIYDIAQTDKKRSLQVLINPRIITSEGSTISEKEGCLSVPDFRADVKRADLVLVEGIDRKERPVRIEAHGLHAIVLQHEIDHLNGILFIDHISGLKKRLYKNRVKKKLKRK